jgi:hypothetical protein
MHPGGGLNKEVEAKEKGQRRTKREKGKIGRIEGRRKTKRRKKDRKRRKEKEKEKEEKKRERRREKGKRKGKRGTNTDAPKEAD